MNIKKIILSAVSAAGICALMTGCGTVKLDPSDYVKVEVNGADGYGKVSLSVDYEDLEDDVIDALGDDSSKSERNEAASFADGIRFEVSSDKTENLTNGDVIEISVDYDEDDAKEDYNFLFKSETFEYKVEDLEEAEVYDPFEGVEITYSGFSPNGKYQVDTSGVKSSELSYYISYEVEGAPDRVANGDVLVLKAVTYNEDYYLELGYTISPDTKEFTVSGLEEGKVIDPFEGLVLEYKGISPDVSVNFDTTNCDEYVRNNVSFRASDSGLANGEKFTVTASYSEDKAEDNGIVISEDEKSYTVENAPYFITDDSTVDFSSLDSDFKDMVESKISGEGYYVGSIIRGKKLFSTVDSDDEYSITEIKITPKKQMFFNAKDTSNWLLNNHLIVWEIKVTAEKTKRSNGGTNDSVDVGKLASGTLLAETYIQNIAINSDGSLNYDEARDKQCKVYYTTQSGAYWDNSLLTMTVDTVAEKWRADNVGDFNVTITDCE